MSTEPSLEEFFLGQPSDSRFSKELDQIQRNNRETDVEKLRFFKRFWVNPTAVLGCLCHALKGCEGGLTEIMGYLRGIIGDHEGYICGTFPLAVRGDGTGISVDSKVLVDKVIYDGCIRKIFKTDRVSYNGWYHSHPNLDVFYSRTDVENGRSQANIGLPCGLVIDPVRTVSHNRLQLGGYVPFPKNDQRDARQRLPNAIMRKYGAAARCYYEVEILFYLTPDNKAVLKDITKRNFGMSLAYSPLELKPSYVRRRLDGLSSSVSELNVSREQSERTLRELWKLNEIRKSNQWLMKKKRAIFA